jgi:HKD family nuclease
MQKKIILLLIVFILVSTGIFHNKKSLPDNISYESPVHQIASEDIYFFQDVTFVDPEDERRSEQEIFDEIFRMIDVAQEYILVDLFLYNNFIGIETSSYRQIAGELTEALLQKKSDFPEMTIQVITDPINIMYGGHISDDFETLRDAGISVTITDVRPLRDSNPLYSAVWRTGLQWFDNTTKEGWLPNPLDQESPDLTIRTYLKMLNFKANHRKVVLTDYNENGTVGFSALITSGNPHDGSSAHSNIAVRIDSHVWQDILITESAVVHFSGGTFVYPDEELLSQIVEENNGTLQTQILTEGKIEKRLLQTIDSTENADTIDIAMFYIADHDVIRALKKADQRGVQIRLLFDPNKDAFGREKNGTPNRQVAHELMEKSAGNTTVRWCDTHGEQCHSKLLLVEQAGLTTLIQGSANYTKRNLQNYNLETNMIVTGASKEQVFADARYFFQSQWNNDVDRFYSTPYGTYKDESYYKTLVYKFKEFTGLSRW